jgi:hypothetical protein
METVMRTSTRIASAALALALFPISALADPTPTPAASPSAAPTAAPSTPSPIAIDICQLRTEDENPFVATTDGVEIKFTNNAKVAATTINFAVSSGAQAGVIRDVGTFAPGLEVTHNYREGSGFQIITPLLSHPHLNCTVQSVQFADGSAWPAVAAASATDGALSASPATLSFAGIGSTYDQFLTVADSGAGATLKESDNCAQIATVSVLASSASGQSLRISSVGPGYCAVHITDGSDHSVMVPVQVSPKS